MPNRKQIPNRSLAPRRARQLARLCLLACPALAWAQPATPETAEVTIIGATPLPGVGLTRQEIAAPVQAVKAAELRAAGASDTADFLARRLGGMHANDMAGNGLQTDVSYRGFTASPLLGTPQGLSVYLDGVRQNQPFGDIVLWDQIPYGALASLSLMPGSNPVFGLNSLGGALVLETKDGLRHPGSAVELKLGSHGRRQLELEHGGANALGLHWYGLLDLQRDAGWREDSPSRLGQAFGKLGWRDSRTELAGTLSLADSRLHGNGLQEQRLLAADWASVYTRPDITHNRAAQLNLTARRELSDDLLLSGNVYWRQLRSDTLNGDVNEAALREELTGDDPGVAGNGLLNRGRTRQNARGLAAQLTVFGELAGQRNQLVLGGAWDQYRLAYAQSTQLGDLNPDRSVTAIPAFADGASGGGIDGVPLDSRVSLASHGHSAGLYAMNTLSLGRQLHLSASARYNDTLVDTADAITPEGPGSLTGRHRFRRLNPAIGAVYAPQPRWQIYAGYNEASRAPSAIELGCADPDNPCRLPNAMAGDPPLRQVVTKTWEMGLRGRTAGGLNWSAGAFQATNHDDILFVASNASGMGYFRNFGKTRRQGLELSLDGRQGPWRLAAHYTLLNATYQSPETVGANGNSSNDAAAAGLAGQEGSIAIRPGDRIPLVPRQILKLHADYAVTPAWTVGAGLVAVGGSFLRGNENNQHQAAAPYYLGAGRTPGYAVVDATLAYRPDPRWQWTARIGNLFDRRYTTAGQLGAAAFDASGRFQSRPFGNGSALQYSSLLAPAAPRSLWIAVRHSF